MRTNPLNIGQGKRRDKSEVKFLLDTHEGRTRHDTILSGDRYCASTTNARILFRGTRLKKNRDRASRIYHE